MKEKDLSKKVRDHIHQLGGFVVKYFGSSVFAEAGIPDILCCIPVMRNGIRVGVFVGIELKAPGSGKLPTPLQLFQLERIRQAGGVAFWADNLAKVKGTLESLTKTKH